MTRKWLVLIMVLILVGVMVSGCTDSTEEVDSGEEADEGASMEEATEVSDAVTGEGQDYAVRMEYYGMMKPSELEINRGDTVAWRNYKPQGTYTLVSDDGLFEDQEMDSNDAFAYTFTESGTYTFSVEDTPDMTLTVTVR